MDDGPAAVAVDPGELGVEAGLGDGECLRSLADTGMLGDGQQAVQALCGAGAVEGAAGCAPGIDPGENSITQRR